VIVATIVLIVGQNAGGVALSCWFGQPAQVGVLLGSVAFVGGLGSAVAWGAVLEQQGMPYATSLGIAGAMLGMILGAALAGPFGVWLAGESRMRGVKAPKPQISTDSEEGDSAAPQGFSRPSVSQWLIAAGVVAATGIGGDVLQRLLVPLQITFPRFLTAMLVAVLITVIVPERYKGVWRPALISLEPLILNVFLAITFATLDLSVLAGMGTQVVLTGLFQAVFTMVVAWWLVFLPLSRAVRADDEGKVTSQRAEAAATAAAVVGYGLSSLSVAMAVLRQMNAMVRPVPLARQTIAVTGAAVVDVINALGIAVSLWVAASL
jgi:glutamate:Na+ symporter, ESS family